MLILRLATRNLFRQKARNTLSMVSIVLGVFVIVLGSGFAGGVNENAIRGQIDSASGHVLAVPKEYPTAGFRHPVDEAFEVTADDRAWLDENTTAWTSRLVAAPRAIKGRESMRVRLLGVSDSDASVFPRDMWKLEGTFPKSESAEILVASGPAGLLGVDIGDVLTLETRTVDGAINAMRYTVSGTLKAGNPMIDNLAVYLPLPAADQLLAANGRVTHVASLVENRDRNAAFAAEIGKRIPDADVRTWQEEVQALIEVGELRGRMFNTMGFAFLLMAATGIANTVLMAAFERVREIGTLRSMGLQRTGILAMFALEGFWMGLIGGGIGVALSGAICSYYATNGMDMTALIEGKTETMSNVPVSAMLYLEYSSSMLVIALVVAIVVSVAASIYPAISASRVSPAEAVRP